MHRIQIHTERELCNISIFSYFLLTFTPNSGARCCLSSRRTRRRRNFFFEGIRVVHFWGQKISERKFTILIFFPSPRRRCRCDRFSNSISMAGAFGQTHSFFLWSILKCCEILPPSTRIWYGRGEEEKKLSTQDRDKSGKIWAKSLTWGPDKRQREIFVAFLYIFFKFSTENSHKWWRE